MEHYLQTPITAEQISPLEAGDYVHISGTIYSARDAAHARMTESEELPFAIENQVIYYMGPSPTRPGHVIGAAGPTTATRMDRYTPHLLDCGLKVMIGKGKRSPEVIEAIRRNGAVYLAAIGGAGALLSRCITSTTVIAYDDLGTEAVRKLEVHNFPAIVVIDQYGGNIYAQTCVM